MKSVLEEIKRIKLILISLDILALKTVFHNYKSYGNPKPQALHVRAIFIIGLVLFPHVLNKTLNTFIESQNMITAVLTRMKIATKSKLQTTSI